ncbi:MAG: hypothetical protein TREMPRED_003007 [Tremellales sp. Tagirdzhanova-0007]|nr:MAG: hypothetical protein TREMPRED_003007 [Tremellales sp. Tagirdzhanova-0007]
MSYGVRGPEKSSNSWVLEEEEAMKHLKHAYDAGINAFDTADAYTAGGSERILGKFLKKYSIPRESVVILTKTYFPAWSPDKFENNSGLSRKRIFASIKNALERLQLEYVDVLQCHRFDYSTPMEETMQALHDVVKAGYVRYIGMSSCFAWEFQMMQQYALHNHLTPFISMQNYHNALYRDEEREMMPTLQQFGVGCIPWSPLGAGLLTRPFSEDKETLRAEVHPVKDHVSGKKEPSGRVIISKVEEISKARGVSMAQVALAWSLSKPFVTAPIVGTTSLEKLDDLIEGCSLKLSEEEIKSIDDLYLPSHLRGPSHWGPIKV